MSWDLLLWPNGGRQVATRHAFAAQLQVIGNFKADPSNSNFTYNNDATGVEFSLSLTPQGALHLNVNYARPTFFAAEALGILSQLASEFGLSVLRNNQSYPFDEPALLSEWSVGNRHAIAAMKDLGVAPKLVVDQKKAFEAWEYRRAYPAAASQLKKHFGEEYLVARLVMLRGGDRVYRAAMLPDITFWVMPPVDLLFWKSGSGLTFIRAERFLDPLQSRLVRHAAVPHAWVAPEFALFEQTVSDLWGQVKAIGQSDLDPASLQHCPDHEYVDVA